MYRSWAQGPYRSTVPRLASRGRHWGHYQWYSWFPYQEPCLVLNLWLGRSFSTYILEGKMTKCQRKRIKTNQNCGFFYTVERVDDWLYLRKQFNPIVSTGNLSYSWLNAGFMNYQRQPLCVDTAVQPAAILPSLSESFQCSFEYGQTECVRL